MKLKGLRLKTVDGWWLNIYVRLNMFVVADNSKKLFSIKKKREENRIEDSSSVNHPADFSWNGDSTDR